MSQAKSIRIGILDSLAEALTTVVYTLPILCTPDPHPC